MQQGFTLPELDDSLGVWLDPASVAIDGRDLRDQLAFVAQFSRMVLYYNSNNQVQGDWQEFYLKDPAILLAAISKTDYVSYHAQFTQLQQGWHASRKETRWLNNLCMLIQKMFATLNLWLRSMRKHPNRFNLLIFLREKVQLELASQLEVFFKVQQALKRLEFPDLNSFDRDVLHFYEVEWRSSGQFAMASDKLLVDYSSQELIEKLGQIFTICFDTLVQVCDQARQDFYKLSEQACDFPDTALLRTFLNVAQAQQRRLNSLSEAHLNFYYQRLLHTRTKPAVADQVYLCVQLNSNVPNLLLPENSEFSAGNYPDQSPILFYSVDTVNLNQIAVTHCYTELYTKTPDANTVWHFEKQALPQQLQYHDNGSLIDFPFWGNRQAQSYSPAIVFASPLFALAEGQRQLLLQFDFLDPCDPEKLWQGARFYLSSNDEWLEVSNYLAPPIETGVQLDLPPAIPPISAFSKPIDGIHSQWPLMKIVFADAAITGNSPVIEKIQITVEVSGLKQLMLANDLASLPMAEPGLMFAPPAGLSARFFLGSAECFAKPLQSVKVQICWDNLPVCLDAYYASYNYFLAGFPQQISPAQTVFSNTCFTVKPTMLSQKSWRPLSSEFSYSLGQGDQQVWKNLHGDQSAPLFSSCCAASTDTVDAREFACKNLGRTEFKITPGADFKPQVNLLLKPLDLPAQADSGYLCLSLSGPAPGFGIEIYPQLVSAISLQNAQKIIQQAKAGLLSLLWKKLCALFKAIAAGWIKFFQVLIKLWEEFLDWLKRLWDGTYLLQDFDHYDQTEDGSICRAIYKANICDDTGLYKLPVAPWQPKYTAISLDYKASFAWQADSSLTDNTGNDSKASYPFEFYHCRPQGLSVQLDLSREEPIGEKKSVNVSLFPVAEFHNACYLALRNLCLPATLSILFEFNKIQDQSRHPSSKLRAYLYTQPTNFEVSILRDETQGLRQSGIIVFDLPELGTTYSLRETLDQSAWLILACDDASVNIRLAFLAPQVLRLQRKMDAVALQDNKPEIAAQSIQSAVPALPQIKKYYQPFASFGGRAAEQTANYQELSSYPRRVAERLLHKDRALSRNDFELLSKQGLDNLYRVIVSKPEKACVCLAPVLHYRNHVERNAWRPRLEFDQLGRLASFIRARSSSQVTVAVANPAYRVVQIAAKIGVAEQVDLSRLREQLNQGLRLYLSPWISCAQPQRRFAQTLQKVELIQFILSFEGVVNLESLFWQIRADQDDSAMSAKFNSDQAEAADVLNCDQDSLWISAQLHQLSLFVTACADQSILHQIPLLPIEQEIVNV